MRFSFNLFGDSRQKWRESPFFLELIFKKIVTLMALDLFLGFS